MHKVDIGVEYPDSRTRYPFFDMHVGDSILFTDRPAADNARVSAIRFVKSHHPEWKFSLRAVPEGWRLWRIK